MSKIISSIITLFLSLFLGFTQETIDEKPVVAQIGATAVQLNNIHIFLGTQSDRLFNKQYYTVLVFWEFNPQYAKKKKPLDAQSININDTYALHEELFKIKAKLLQQQQTGSIKLIAINSEPPKQTESYLKGMVKKFKAEKRTFKISYTDYNSNQQKEIEKEWEFNYSFAYDPVVKTKTKSTDNPILRGKTWEYYPQRFGKTHAPIIFIIGKPFPNQEFNNPETPKTPTPESLSSPKVKKKSKKAELPNLPDSRVLWIGEIKDLSKKIDELLNSGGGHRPYNRSNK